MTEPNAEVWFDASIEKVRIASTPGGDSFDAEAARSFREELDAAIAQLEDAEADQ